MNTFAGETRFYDGAELRTHFRNLIEASDMIDIATAWVTDSALVNLLLSLTSKTSVRMVVGVGGYNTNPVTLRKLSANPNITLKIFGGVEPPLFHPKFYLFQRAHFRRLAIGSMNLTNAGAVANVESMLSFEDKAKQGDKEFARFWLSPLAKSHREFDLDGYDGKRRLLLNAVKNANAEDVLDEDVAATAESSQEIDGLKAGWKTFVSELNGSPNGIEGYQRVLDARKQFISRDWSQDFTDQERTFMFGVAPYYAFGNLSVLKQNEAQFQGPANRWKRQEIGEALRTATNLRHLEVDLVRKIVERLLKVPHCKAALATRLLIFARPDFFVVVNRKSFEGLSERFGMFISERDFDASSYVKLLQRIHTTEWYRSPEPSDPDERYIWQSRAALVDALVYREKFDSSTPAQI